MHKSYIIYKRQKVKVTILLEKSKKLLPNVPNLVSLDKESHDIGEAGIPFKCGDSFGQGRIDVNLFNWMNIITLK